MRKWASGLVLFLFVGCFGFSGQLFTEEPNTVSGKPRTTADNLLKAYEGESLAHAKYLAFAQKADEEGYGQVASLFRAAAHAEQIHINNHRDVMTKLGIPVAALEIQAPEVKSTRENLEAALRGETYEKDAMYPEMIKTARAEGNREALRSFSFARSAEIEHAKLYAEAVANLENWKAGKKDFHICPVCGFTVAVKPSANCPVCFAAAEKFELVN